MVSKAVPNLAAACRATSVAGSGRVQVGSGAEELRSVPGDNDCPNPLVCIDLTEGLPKRQKALGVNALAGGRLRVSNMTVPSFCSETSIMAFRELGQWEGFP